MSSTESPRRSDFLFINRRRMFSKEQPWNHPKFDITLYSLDTHRKFLFDQNTPINFPKLAYSWEPKTSLDNTVPFWRSHSSDIKPLFYEPAPVTSPPAAQATHRSSEWGAAALGWAGGTLVLALFVLLVRATEKCLDKKFFKSRRRQSEEWQTPVVFVTRSNRSEDSELGSAGRPADLEDIITEPITAADLPPAYCDCTTRSKEGNDGTYHCTNCEDDPPSYSDVYVPVNPKGRHSAVYVFCRTGTPTRRPKPTNNVISNDTATDMENVSECSNELGAPDLVIPLEDDETNKEQVNDDAESQKAEGKV